MMQIRFAGNDYKNISSPAQKKYIKAWLNDDEKEILPNHDEMVFDRDGQDLYLGSNKGKVLVGVIPKETGYDNALSAKDVKQALEDCNRELPPQDQAKPPIKGYSYIDIFKDAGHDGIPYVVSRLRRTPFWNTISSPEKVRAVPVQSAAEEKKAIQTLIKEWQTVLNTKNPKDIPSTFDNAMFGLDCFLRRPN